MAIKNYNQAGITIQVNSTPITGLMDGTPITVTFRGGEVDVTEGMDGPGLNMATRQGGSVKFTLRETSDSHALLLGLRLIQEQTQGIESNIVTVLSGARTLFTLTDAFISLPGDLTTGDKKMAGQDYTFVGTGMESAPSII